MAPDPEISRQIWNMTLTSTRNIPSRAHRQSPAQAPSPHSTLTFPTPANTPTHPHPHSSVTNHHAPAPTPPDTHRRQSRKEKQPENHNQKHGEHAFRGRQERRNIKPAESWKQRHSYERPRPTNFPSHTHHITHRTGPAPPRLFAGCSSARWVCLLSWSEDGVRAQGRQTGSGEAFLMWTVTVL